MSGGVSGCKMTCSFVRLLSITGAQEKVGTVSFSSLYPQHLARTWSPVTGKVLLDRCSERKLEGGI